MGVFSDASQVSRVFIYIEFVRLCLTLRLRNNRFILAHVPRNINIADAVDLGVFGLWLRKRLLHSFFLELWHDCGDLPGVSSLQRSLGIAVRVVEAVRTERFANLLQLIEFHSVNSFGSFNVPFEL